MVSRFFFDTNAQKNKRSVAVEEVDKESYEVNNNEG